MERKTKLGSVIEFTLKMLFLLVLIGADSSCKKDDDGNPPPPPPPTPDFFIRSVDLSFTPQIAAYNVTYYAGDTAKPILQLVKDKGINTIRVRLWYAPADGHSSLSEVLDFAKQIKLAGLKFWLDIHYSDTWCDPAHQSKPAAWNSLNLDQLKDSVFAYTKNVMTTLSQNNVTPDYVQIGNETNNGMLWPEGQIYSSSGTNWNNFIELVENGIAAVKEVSPSTATIIHYAQYQGADYYFGNLTTLTPDYDIMAISYYPPWHGKSIDSVQMMVSTLASQFGKPVVIAETAYPWTLDWNDWTNNVVGLPDQLIPDYPATPDGQAAYLSALISAVKSAAGTDNFGVSYWAADWVAYKGTTATDGSSWENQALFDFQIKALPALDSLGKK
ncbi:MAG: arabinogalactan endo-1,4-beta-galactosidase [Chitinophagales bacterium]|nr:arabinogalactan endo-1,4-beta-galactosidase [Chitinophagales bacterium]